MSLVRNWWTTGLFIACLRCWSARLLGLEKPYFIIYSNGNRRVWSTSPLYSGADLVGRDSSPWIMAGKCPCLTVRNIRTCLKDCL
ncbi:hypothetical protein LY78DRAFT_75826 [Colletotrichum sublineola]|nr:hypothetical protein LY78DRAFT_75826 [Colletotrichum sublineola]